MLGVRRRVNQGHKWDWGRLGALGLLVVFMHGIADRCGLGYGVFFARNRCP